MEALLIIIGLLTAAVIQIEAVAALFRRHTTLVLFSYLAFIVLWDFYAVFEFVFIYYLSYIPKSGKLGYLLFMGILCIMVHGLTVIFFVNFIRKWLQKNLSWFVRILLFLPFLIIQVTYTRHAINRLIQDPEPRLLDVSAPYSGGLMLLLVFLWLVYAIFAAGKLKDPILKKNIRLFSYLTVGGLAVLVLLLFNPQFGNVNFMWIFARYSFLSLGINVPGYFVLRTWLRRWKGRVQDYRLPENLSKLKNKYSLSPREQEIISLVLYGNSNGEIAHQVYISLETVKKHIYNVYKKIGVKNRLQLMNILLQEEKK